MRAGNIVRRRLAAGLLHSAQVARCALEVMTGEVAPDTGLLAAASGETAERIGLDSGLYPQLAPLYASVISASLSLQVGRRLPAAWRLQRRYACRQRPGGVCC